jgi:hypothetical protein
MFHNLFIIFCDVGVLRHRYMDTKCTQYFNQQKNVLHEKFNGSEGNVLQSFRKV